MGEGTLDLIPLAGLQTAVGVDPELLRADWVFVSAGRSVGLDR